MYATSVTFDRIFDPAEREEWQSLEEMAIMVAGGQYNLPAGYRPNLQLLHAKTDNSMSPLVVVGGKERVTSLSETSNLFMALWLALSVLFAQYTFYFHELSQFLQSSISWYTTVLGLTCQYLCDTHTKVYFNF